MADEDSQFEAELEIPSEPDPPQEERHRHWAMNIIGIAGVLALCYYGESVLAVVMISILVAFVLAPVVDALTWFHLPRGLAAFIAIVLLVTVLLGIVYASYNQATILMQDLPKYASKIRAEVMRFRTQAESLEVLEPEPEKDVVNVRPARDWTDILTRGFGSASTAILSVSFVPFLAYFMLTWQQHVRSATVMLFSLENRHTAYTTLGLISAMIRSFMVGNVVIGLMIGAASTLVFAVFRVPFFYFVGFMSGFLSLIPYMGILLALVPPIFVGLGHLEFSDLLLISIIVLVLHLIALNVLYPKILGNHLQLVYGKRV